MTSYYDALINGVESVEGCAIHVNVEVIGDSDISEEIYSENIIHSNPHYTCGMLLKKIKKSMRKKYGNKYLFRDYAVEVMLYGIGLSLVKNDEPIYALLDSFEADITIFLTKRETMLGV